MTDRPELQQQPNGRYLGTYREYWFEVRQGANREGEPIWAAFSGGLVVNGATVEEAVDKMLQAIDAAEQPRPEVPDSSRTEGVGYYRLWEKPRPSKFKPGSIEAWIEWEEGWMDSMTVKPAKQTDR